MSRSRTREASSSGAERTSSSSCLIIEPIRMTLAGCSTSSATLPPPRPRSARPRGRSRRGAVAAEFDGPAVRAHHHDALLGCLTRRRIAHTCIQPDPGPPRSPGTATTGLRVIRWTPRRARRHARGRDQPPPRTSRVRPRRPVRQSPATARRPSSPSRTPRVPTCRGCSPRPSRTWSTARAWPSTTTGRRSGSCAVSSTRSGVR